MGWAFLFIFLFFAVVIGAVIAVQVGRVRDHRRRQQEVWGRIAERRGCTLTPATGWFGHHGMVVPIGDRQVRVLVHNGIAIDKAAASKHQTGGGWHTIVDAPYEAGAGPAFSIRKRGFLDGKSAATFSDEALDQRFHVGDVEGAFDTAWTDRAKALLRNLDERIWLVSGGNMVSAVWGGVLTNETQLEALINLVGELTAARAGAEG